MGGSINNAQGKMLIDDSRPTARSRRPTITAFAETTGYDSDWNVTAHAICIDR